MSGIALTVSAHTSAPPEVAFDTIAPIDLARIFERWLLIPGVAGVRDQSGPWDAVGRTRTVMLSDGTGVEERLTRFDRPNSFGYRVGPFPPPLGRLASEADGEWRFAASAGGGTEIEWTYRFVPRPGGRMLTRLVIAPLWRGYARRAVERASSAADAALSSSRV